MKIKLKRAFGRWAKGDVIQPNAATAKTLIDEGVAELVNESTPLKKSGYVQPTPENKKRKPTTEQKINDNGN